jgi:serine/threonine-protein kinase
MDELLPRLQAALADRYTIERELGRGGMATVYLASDLKHGREVAIKVLRAEVAAVIGRDRFLREIQIAARLQHPHVLPLFDSGEAAGWLYYVMPYVEGESLRDRVNREKQLPIDDALQIAREVADALAYAHSVGIVHRDIKPENILLSAGHALVADFGVARALSVAGGTRLTETGIAVGTPLYMSPEQASGEVELDGRSDIYSLGCVLYESLAGEAPFTGSTAQAVMARHSLDPVPSLRTVRSTVSVALDCAVARALAKVPADRYPTAQQFADVLAAGGLLSRPRTTWARRARRVALAGVIGAAAIGLWRASPLARSPGLDARLLAVAPFDILVPGAELWREGLVDVFARNLDGVGPLRAVPPSVVLRRFSGRADRASARALGKRVGARLVLTGSLLGAGPDSVRLAVTLLDVARDRAVAEFELRGSADRVDLLLDSATVRVVRELGREQPIGAVRAAGMPTTSLAALKAFLQGEQLYRQTAWDSAFAYYKRTVDLDSTFASAWWRMAGIRGCSRMGMWPDSLVHGYVLQAAALSHALPARESLLVAGDSLFEALADPDNPRSYEHRVRMLTTLDEATRRYPTDPEVWFEFGDALTHWRVGTPQQALATFERAIALDSSFAPAYLHAVDLAVTVGRPELARRQLATYLALNITDKNSEGLGLAAQLFMAPSPWPLEVVRQVESASAYVLFAALIPLRRLGDSAETAVRLARAVVDAPSGADRMFDNPATRRSPYANTLAYRGHLGEAHRVGGTTLRESFVQVALLGGLPAESVTAVLGSWVREPVPPRVPQGWLSARLLAMPWWAANDTAALALVVARWDSLAATVPQHSLARVWALYGAQAGRAYLALARRDSTDARRRFTALADDVCPCLPDRILTARLLAAEGRLEQAAAVLERAWPWRTLNALEPVWHLERARLAERMGKRDVATAAYRFVVDVWRNADPELDAYVAEARAALKRLGGEPR